MMGRFSARVLIMEDDQGLSRLLQIALTRAGYSVDVAGDGEEGLAKLADGSYDIVAVDHHMPVYDGLEVIRILAAQGTLPPTIMVTGTGNETIAVEAMKMGARDYIVKDIDAGFLKLLPTVIERVLAQQRMEEERRRSEELLQRSRKMESLALMAGGVAHDFNNLLQGIISYAEMGLAAAGENARARDCLQGILKGAKKGSELSLRMLDYTGKRMTLPAPLNLSEVVREMHQELLDLAAATPGVKLELAIADGLPQAFADASQLRQVILSLATNACEAMDPQGGTITIRGGWEEVTPEQGYRDLAVKALAPGRYVALEIADTGCGMSEETLPKIFDPFFTTKFQGRGLGLSMVFGIVRRHKGTILYDSAPGRGTTVKVLLPVFTPEPVSGKPAGEAAAMHAQA